MINTKKCNCCNYFKPINEFAKDKRSKDGYQYRCKKCSNAKINEYYKTKEGLISLIYAHQRSNSKKYKRNLPNYTNIELKQWILKETNFNILYDNWVNSRYNKWKKPSIDRIDNKKPYTLDNIQLITWQENANKGHYIELSKKINQYDLQNNFIYTFNSFMDIERKLKIDRSSVWNVCNNNIKQAGGFIWKYA